MTKKLCSMKVAAYLFALLIVTNAPIYAQQMKPKMATNIPTSVTTPNNVESRLGTLNFFDGLPDDATVQKLYDNLDYQHGVQAYLDALPAADFHAIRSGARTFGPANQTLLITETLMDSRSLVFVPNTESVYNFIWLDAKAEPLVIEMPTNMLGFINDFWGRYVIDVGRPGPDKGQGGKYLLIPPGYTGEIPEGYFVMHSRTYGNFLCFRGLSVNGDFRPAVENIKSHFRVYPLSQVANPPEMNIVNVSGLYFNMVPDTDTSYFKHIDEVVQEEPLEAVDPEIRGLLASIGIRKGTPFAPDARMKGILADAVVVGNATARALVFSTRDPNAFFYPNSAWQTGWIGNDMNWSPGGVLDINARALFFYFGWGMSPAMTWKMIGIGSQYALVNRDASGQYFDGGKSYKLHLPPNIPAKDFWSVVVYDPQTRSMLQTDQQFPSASNLREGIQYNPDNSVDIYFGPKPPPGKENNWIQTMPGKGWFSAFRLYGPLESWFDQSWRPGEVERVQ